MTDQPDLFDSGEHHYGLHKPEDVPAALFFDDARPTYQSIHGLACAALIVVRPDEVTLLVRRDPRNGNILDMPRSIPVDRKSFTQIAPGVEVKLHRVTGSVYCELEVNIALG